MSSLNEIKEIFDEIVKICEEKISQYGERGSYFMEPATEEEILEWEKLTNIQIPETYREWLKLTACCRICGTTANYYFPEEEQPEYIPEDYVEIGEVVGDGEFVCFSKSKGNFITYFEGEINEEYEDFVGMLKEVKRMLKGELSISMDEKLLMLERLKELNKKEEGGIV